MSDIWLSPHFKLSEFTCPDGCGFGTREEDVSQSLVELLELTRLEWGRPLIITSGCRCYARNLAIGGGTRSRHLRGVAADLGISDPGERMKYLSLVKTMYNAGLIPKLGGLGWKMYKNGCVHLDTDRADDGHLRVW